MSGTGLVRTQYWNVSGPNPTPRSGMTSRAESRTDVEGYLLAADAARNAVTYEYGVAGGLEVSATTGETAITVAPGVALDLEGHIVVLAEGGSAIVDPFVGPSGVQNIPTVPVEPDGVVFDTTGSTGELLFTITWREVEEATSGLLVLNQAPWLRLVDPATFTDDGLQLVLAVVSLGTGGVVDALSPGLRRYIALPASRIDLHLPTLDPTGPSTGPTGATVRQRPAAVLAVRGDGGVDLNLIPSAGSVRAALSVAGATGDVELAAGLRVGAATALAAGLTVAAGVETAGELTVAGTVTAGADVAVAGALTTGGDLAAAAKVSAGSDLDVAGSITAGGGFALAGGAVLEGALNAADTKVTTLAVTGAADVGTTLAVHGRTTVGTDLSVSRNVLVDGRVGVRKTNPSFELDVAGTICANTFCNPSDLRVKSDVRELEDVLDRLAAVRAVSFVRTEDPVPERRQAGVVAQDVVEVLPELVVPMGADGLMAVDYAGLAGVLVGAVNELSAVAGRLAARVAELERRCGSDVCG